LKICPKCKSENTFDGAQFCKNCGTPLTGDSAPPPGDEKSKDDGLEFTVTEATEPRAPELAEKRPRDKASVDSGNEEIEITSTENILDMGVEDDEITRPPIESKPPNEPEKTTDDILENKGADDILKNYEESAFMADSETIPDKPPEPEFEPKPQSIKDSPPQAADRPADSDPETPSQSDIIAIDDPAKAEKVHKAPKMRGVAYYRKNTIEIVGNVFLHEGDEIAVNSKPYLLKPKSLNLSSKKTIGIFAGALVVVLIIVASLFMRTSSYGSGEIVGMVLDERGRPFLESAQVKIVELNRQTMTDAQGFFHFEDIPTGTYAITYQLAEDFVGSGIATVTGGHTTLSTFSDLMPMDEYLANIEAEKKSPKAIKDQSTGNRDSEKSSSPVTKTETPITKKTPSSSDQKSSSEYGNIKLAANVDNARLTVDGKILGAGNNTYTKIKSGKHKVRVDKDGYKDYTETITVKKDKTITVAANLTRLKENKTKKLTADDYLAMGNDNMKAGKHQAAIDDYNRAIEISPGMAKVYDSRANAYAAAGETEPAVKDYIRSGEIRRMNDQPSNAIKSFDKALNLVPENISALIGRGGAREDKNEYRMALKDYEEILSRDKYHYQAQYYAGRCYFKLGDHKKAEKAFKRAHKINDSDPYLLQYMMLTYLARDNIKNLQRIYSEYKIQASPAEMAEFKSNSRFEPVLRLIKEEDR
jgi:tetratricopeptide (TPR) repeat protein